MGTYYDGYGNIPNYGGSGERHEGDNLDHRVVDRNDVVANDWVGNRYGTGGSTYAGGAYAGPARQGGREAVMPETLKRRRLEADAPRRVLDINPFDQIAQEAADAGLGFVL